MFGLVVTSDEAETDEDDGARERGRGARVWDVDGHEYVDFSLGDTAAMAGHAPVAAGGYQKFLGLELKLSCPSPIREPLLMDARVAQRDGFRFFIF